MTSAKTSPLKNKIGIPLWSQALIGLGLIGFIYMIANMGPLYVSEWVEENSTYYENTMAALNHFGISPAAPTLVVFWEKDCQVCTENFQEMSDINRVLRIYGVHTTTTETTEVKKSWVTKAPKFATLIIDRSDLLLSSFGVKGVPRSTLILPREKKMYSYIGNIKFNKKKLIKLVKDYQ